MSYYNHPYYSAPHYGFATHSHPHQHPHAPPHHAHHGFPPAPPPHFYDHHYYSHPAPPAPAFPPAQPHATQDLDSQERDALAYLHSIQARKAESESKATAARAKVIAEKEREAAAARAVKVERELLVRAELAKRQALIERESAIQEAHQRRAAALQQAKTQALAYAKAKAIAYAQAKIQADRASRESYINKIEEKKRQCLEFANRENERRVKCASACRARTQNATQTNEFKDINGLLGALFGINVVGDSAPEAPSTATPAATTSTSAPASAPAPVPAVSVPAPATESKKNDNSPPAFPEDINHLLSQFLGLRVEPTSESTESPLTNGIPAGLNEFLGQFGLQFEPTSADEKTQAKASAPTTAQSTPTPALAATQSTSVPPASASAPASHPQAESSEPKVQPAPSTSSATASTESPLAALFSEYANLPPFVRDILANVEQAFTEESRDAQAPAPSTEKFEGKGKGVAEGERPTKPQAPTSAETDDETLIALTQLESISSRLESLKKEFTFPSTLSFSPTPTGNGTDVPALLFNRPNSGYHAQAHSLLQLLLAADNVVSGGNRDVRKKRKEIVKAVEGEIQRLESKRDQVWEEVKERREKEGESDTEDYHHSSDTSSIDHEENHTSEIAEPNTAAPKTETGYSVEPVTAKEESHPVTSSSTDTSSAQPSTETTSSPATHSIDTEAKADSTPVETSTEPSVPAADNTAEVKDVEKQDPDVKEEDFELV